ncbi:MAG: hypothetical protein WD003_02050 [Candidatus Paceibacterota bacterium]
MNTVLSLPTRGQNEVFTPIEDILAYEHPALVVRITEKLGLSEEKSKQLFEDTKRFLYLCAISEKTISPNEVLDFGWHEFILFMRDYENFCKKCFGRTIYHRPRHPDDPPTNGEGGRRALALAHEIFGEELSENWQYPRLEIASDDPCGDHCGCGAACNDD